MTYRLRGGQLGSGLLAGLLSDSGYGAQLGGVAFVFLSEEAAAPPPSPAPAAGGAAGAGDDDDDEAAAPPPPRRGGGVNAEPGEPGGRQWCRGACDGLVAGGKNLVRTRVSQGGNRRCLPTLD